MAANDPFSPAPTSEPVLSVWGLTLLLKELVEGAFPSVWVAGEISNWSRPQSGHCYLTLKDDQAQIKAVIWRNTAARLRFEPYDGLEVICRGHLDLYAPRGTYQIVVEELHPKGEGALELAFRRLKEKLAAEGLFSPDRKRPLPWIPRQIAFVTSPSGAAVRDFLQVLRRRWIGASVLIIPARVQGSGAAQEIASGIELANQIAELPPGAGGRPIDVLVVGRGGGSLEDLWCFNEETVVRAIYASRIPVVSAVGHEIDVTLSDLVADVRALTPSEAAERVAPDAGELRSALDERRQRLRDALRRQAAVARRRLDQLADRRWYRRPFDRLLGLSEQLDQLQGRAYRAARRELSLARELLRNQAGRIEALSPLGVLARGYTLTTRMDDQRIVRWASELAVGDRLSTRYAEGISVSRVEAIETEGVARIDNHAS